MSDDKVFTPADEDSDDDAASAEPPATSYSEALAYLSSADELLESAAGMTTEKIIAYSIQAAQVHAILAIVEVLGEQAT